MLACWCWFISVRENLLFMVSFLMKQFQLLREISCLEREENRLPWRKDNFIDRIKKLWRSCENWPSARRNAGNKIWESCDNNWVWNSIDKSFCSSVLPLFLSIVTAVLLCFSPLSIAQPIPKISQNCFISQCLACVVLPLLVNTVWWSDKMSCSPFFYYFSFSQFAVPNWTWCHHQDDALISSPSSLRDPVL